MPGGVCAHFAAEFHVFQTISRFEIYSSMCVENWRNLGLLGATNYNSYLADPNTFSMEIGFFSFFYFFFEEKKSKIVSFPSKKCQKNEFSTKIYYFNAKNEEIFKKYREITEND